MIKKILLCLSIFFCFSSFSQNLILSGNVNDENTMPVAFANVVLYDADGLNLIHGTTTNEAGYFKIENIAINNYILKVTYLGYEEASIPINLQSNTNLENIILKEKSEVLEGITVIAKKTTVKRLVDRLVFNVENSTLSNNNVLDVLKHTPGVLVHNGAITVKNSTPTVYINDRKVHLSTSEVQQLLAGTSATNIKSIEVITNPPAKYEAEGGAVINIITSKNIVSGYNGSVFGNYKQGKFAKYTFGTNHFFKSKKLDIYTNFSMNPREDFRHNNEYINFINNNQITTSWETDFKRRRESKNQNVNANIDYTIDDRNTIGFSTNLLLSPRENKKTNVNSFTEVFDANHVLDSTFHTLNKKVDETFNLAFTLDYVHKFKKEGEKLSVSVHYTNYDFSSFQIVDTDYRFPDNVLIKNNKFQTFSSQKIKLYTGQLDYELPIDNTSQFEAGFKLSNINSESILKQYNFENEIKIEDLENSDTFLYDEHNYAIYASYSKDWKNWSLKTGLRTEFTNIVGTSISTNQINKNYYLKTFPSLYIQNRINDKNEIYFNYNKRIYRPRYSQLNPFKYFLNDNAYITGDPNLQPQIDDVFTLGYTINQTYTFEAYYRYENAPTLEIIFQDNTDNILKYINTNIKRSIEFGFDFTTYTEIIKNWNLYVLSSLFYYDNQFFALESNNELFTTNKWSVYAEVINYFTFLKDKSLTADVSYLFISSIANGPSQISNRSGLDVNFRKTLWDNRASVSIGVTDIFNTQNFIQTTKYLNQDALVNSRLENRLIIFGFNYKFGNFRLQNNNKNIELNERDRLN